MVEYRRWISLLFEVHGESAEATVIMREGGRYWSNHPELKDATVSEARRVAKTL